MPHFLHRSLFPLFLSPLERECRPINYGELHTSYRLRFRYKCRAISIASRFMCKTDSVREAKLVVVKLWLLLSSRWQSRNVSARQVTLATDLLREISNLWWPKLTLFSPVFSVSYDHKCISMYFYEAIKRRILLYVTLKLRNDQLKILLLIFLINLIKKLFIIITNISFATINNVIQFKFDILFRSPKVLFATVL